MYHDIIIDDEGNIYVADSSDKTIKKFQQKKSEWKMSTKTSYKKHKTILILN